MRSPISILICGIGGQGVKLLSHVTAQAAARNHPHVCHTESRGLSQRGGSVFSEVRFGAKPLAPMLGAHRVDFVLALDALEALRAATNLNGSGLLIANSQYEVPLHLKVQWSKSAAQLAGQAALNDWVRDALETQQKAQLADLPRLALRAGSPKVMNAILLGLASVHLPIAKEDFRDALAEFLAPDWREINLRGFEIGRQVAHTHAAQWAPPAPPGIPLLLCMSSRRGSDRTNAVPKSRNS